MGCIDHGQRGDKDGYGKALRVVGGKAKYYRLHRLKFYEAHGYWPEVVMHTCDNPRCINLEHLVAGTHKLNMADRASKGRNKLCTGLPGKLSPDVIREIRQSTLSERLLGQKYGISPAHAGNIRRGYRCA